ncbi:pentapeptide repeat-containing protein [uncultured Croceitalea sp.]|uniref:pentapeptide repeat-containing protein n=1 Tax=uncultured Croceitalea sp. TaxID=1798908 RepID=UPI003305CEFD
MNKPFVADRYFKNEDFTKNPLPKADYEECTFDGCQFQEGYLDNQNFVDCTFVSCNLSNTNIAHTTFNDVRFDACKLIGVQFDKAEQGLLTLQFSSCHLNLSIFYGMVLQKTSFQGSNLSQADFTETDLTNADFTDCNLDNTIFEQTILNKANLTLAFNFSIDPEKNSLKKTRFTKEGLIGLLKKHDIVVD